MNNLPYIGQAREMGFADEIMKEVLKRKYETNGQFYTTLEEFYEALFTSQTALSHKQPFHRRRDRQTFTEQGDTPGQSRTYIFSGDTWKENFRLSTFRRFPLECPVAPAELASSGFYYTGYKDMVKCFSCGLCVENWIIGDDVTLARWHRTDCDYANGKETNNEPLIGLYRRHLELLQNNHQRGSTGAKNFTVVNGYTNATTSVRNNGLGNYPTVSNRIIVNDIPSTSLQRQPFPQNPYPFNIQQNQDHLFPCNYPINSYMQSPAVRLESFKPRNGIRWPREKLRAGIDALVNAGFFYLGERDRVKCWYCNGGLQNWDYEDDSWTEHAKWFPSCEYLNRVKGPVFVENIVSQYPDLNRPTPTVVRIPRSRPQDADIPFVPKPSPIPAANPTEAVERVMNNLPYVWKARVMGFSDSKIKEVLERKYQTSGQFYHTSEDFYEAIFTSQAAESSLPQKQQVVQPNTAALKDEERLNSMLAQLRELEETRVCKVCRSEVSNIVLIPCGHLASCDKCIGALRRCPICCHTVQSLIKVLGHNDCT